MMGEQDAPEPTLDRDHQNGVVPDSQGPRQLAAALDEFIDTEHITGAAEGSTLAEHPRTEVVPEPPAPVEPRVSVLDLKEERLKEVETCLREHPPRDFRHEKLTEVYQGYIGFVEIHVDGANLPSGTNLTIPKELAELGLVDNLRRRLSEKMRIDLSGRIDLGDHDVNEHVNAFRTLYTRQMGAPLGRIYKKGDWDAMQSKWTDIEKMVAAANEKIQRSMRQEVQNILADSAKDWAESITNNNTVKDSDKYTEDDILKMLSTQWNQKHRSTTMKVHLFAKDFTWATLNSPGVRRKIEDTYPELRETGLYKSSPAWAV